jgi:carboxymethylenebutenolidase
MTNGIISLKAGDGFELSAYCARPSGTPRGAVVVVQEIFGVNDHIQEVTEQFCEFGYTGVAPAIFDRIERSVSLGYGADDFARAKALYQKVKVDPAVADVAAAVQYSTQFGRVGVVGYCFGGLLAWLASCKVPNVSAAVGYYGGGITDNLALVPRAPTMLHFGSLDQHVPIEPALAIPRSHPSITVYAYEADHGFNCDERPSFNKDASDLAMQRTVAFLRKHIG